VPAATVPKNALSTGPGYLYLAALGTSLPANTVVGSVFTDAWPGGWNLLGITKQGHEFDYTIGTTPIEAAEYFDPLQIVTDTRSALIKMELQQVHATNMKNSLNGGTLTVTGSGTTQLNAYTPPAPGSEVRCMIGWEATDNTERLIMEQCFQTGSLAIQRQKGASNATLPVEFTAELPASGFPFRYYTAGTLRG
jgi:hypothetical protein